MKKNRLFNLALLLVAVLFAQDSRAQTTLSDLELSVNPAIIREDAGKTDIEVTVEVTDDTAVDADTYVVLTVSFEGSFTRYLIELTTLRIPVGEKKATGTVTLYPVNDDIADEDLPIVLSGHAHGGKTVGSATITLIDDDKDSQNIDLSVDIAELTKESIREESIREDAGETTIELKVTLTDASVEDETVNFAVLSAGAVLPSGDTVTETPLRDVHYTLAFGPPLTIPAGATEGTTTFTITPTNDTDAAQRGTIYIQITVGDVVATRTIVLLDDDTNSMNISLTAEPVAISEGAGTTDVTLTATLDGSALAEDATVNVTTDDESTATRDVDYTILLTSLTIPAGAVSGTTTITITPVDDRTVEADETIRLTVPDANNQITAQDDEGDDVTLTVGIVDITLQDTGAGGALSFAADASIADQTYAIGVAIADLVLPEASGGDGELTYSVSSLPAGLSFDGVTRTLAGTPTEASALTVTYTVTDDNSATSTLTFAITIRDDDQDPDTDDQDPDTDDQDPDTDDQDPDTDDQDPDTDDQDPDTDDQDPDTDDQDPDTDDQDPDTGAGGTPSTSITLSANPATISEGAGTTTVTLTATLDGSALAEDATGYCTINYGASTALRDVDYAITLTSLTIPAGSVSGTAGVSVVALADNEEEGDEIIRVVCRGPLGGGEVDITIRDSGAAKAAIQTRPEAFSLANNFPNPFNPTTTIKYALPQAADVELTVYNVVGQPVRTLVAEHQSAGRYAVEWDATNDSGHSLSSGMYFYRLQAGEEFREIKKMLLLK